ncbi:MAG: DUF2178 domain-containing protein [Spirochaetaceae bacterium]|nr:DUF2178 domain-containing protein [Spirochaetaceae bacterium]
MLFKTAKNFEEFKENEKLARILIFVLSVIALIGIYLCFRLDKNSYQSGFFTGIFSAMVFYLIKLFRLSKNESKLKAEFIKTYDERNILIQQQASQKTVSISIIGIGMASLISSIFNMQIALTLGLTCVSIALVFFITIALVKKRL